MFINSASVGFAPAKKIRYGASNRASNPARLASYAFAWALIISPPAGQLALRQKLIIAHKRIKIRNNGRAQTLEGGSQPQEKGGAGDGIVEGDE